LISWLRVSLAYFRGRRVWRNPTVAPSFGVELRPVDVRDPEQIERDITAFAGDSNGGLIVTQNALAILNR